VRIRDLSVIDLRFPTSRTHAGTDAVHVDPDYSAAYVILTTDEGVEGHGLTFTIGRGNEVVVAAIQTSRHLVIDWKTSPGFGDFWRRLASGFAASLARSGRRPSRPRGNRKCAVGSLREIGRQATLETVGRHDAAPVRCIDFRYIEDALTRDEAVGILERNAHTKANREAGCAASVTRPIRRRSAGWGPPTRQFDRVSRRRRMDTFQSESRGERMKVADALAWCGGRSARITR
jgi:L-fuconate dehydratase